MFGLWWITLASALPPAPRIALGLDVTEDPSGVLCYPSGLQVRVAQREGSELAAVSMVLEGGASLEDDTTRSAAHMLEHLWFQSSPGGGPTVWRRGSGLALDATTRADVTTFTTVGAAADLDRLLALEAARLTDPLQGVTRLAEHPGPRHAVAGQRGAREVVGGVVADVGLHAGDVGLQIDPALGGRVGGVGGRRGLGRRRRLGGWRRLWDRHGHRRGWGRRLPGAGEEEGERGGDHEASAGGRTWVSTPMRSM